ncbi:MAG: hypothetical protein AB1847_09520 [bacterium]
MEGRIDKLFSPQRLRQNWKKPVDSGRGEKGKTGETKESLSSGRPQGAAAFAGAIRLEFELLRSLIHRQFTGDKSRLLDMMLEELHKLLNAADEAPNAEAGGDMTVLCQSIEEVLNHIEDLVEAWDV